MNDSQSPSSDTEFASASTTQQDGGRSRQSDDDVTTSSQTPTVLGTGVTVTEASRDWRDVFWLGIFTIHLIGLGFLLSVLGLNRFQKPDRLKIDKYTYRFIENQSHLTETYWPFYAVAGAVGTTIGWIWLLLLGSRANQMMKISVHILTTYLAVISVFCFWGQQFFWGIAFAIGAGLQFMYVISIVDRLPFTMLVLQKAVKMVWSLPEVMMVTCAFMMVMLLWMGIWSFGVSGVVASGIGDGGRWWLLVVSWFSQ